MKISEIITDKYKLLIPPTVYYDLLADVVEAEEEQGTCEDCISRQAVLDALQTCYDTDFVQDYNNGFDYICFQDAVDEVEKLPSVQLIRPKTEWIPVSERLPEDFQRVLVTVVNYNGNKVVRVAEYDNYKGVFRIKENHEEWELGEKGLLAWMPLPEPYRTESEVEK